MSKVEITVIFFAKSRELVKKESAQLPVITPLSYTELKQQLIQYFPQLIPIQESFILALNQEYLQADQGLLQLSPVDTIAVIPPISGG